MSNKNKRIPCLFFFIGTTAELIKMFPVIQKVKEYRIPYQIIASGQNNIADTDIAKKLNIKIDLQISNEEDIKKNAVGLFSWWLKTLPKAKKAIYEKYYNTYDFDDSIMVVHGDTISTTMGAIVGKLLDMDVAHVEAGLRSKHLLIPFPEEIDRLLTSILTRYHFAPGSVPYNALPSYSTKINTVYNTIIDSLEYSKTVHCQNTSLKVLFEKEYCVFVCHRQENLMNKEFVEKVVDSAIKTANSKHVVFIMHKITENTLMKLGLYDKIKNNKNITVLDRIDYFDFMKILENSLFVITDGGSNQEELAYMGKPALILRKRTERQDGLGENVLLYEGDMNKIDEFLNTYEQYKRNPVEMRFSPSDVIADKLKLFLED